MVPQPRLSRRALLGILAGVAMDPERLLWRPGKLISIPKPTVNPPVLCQLLEYWQEDRDCWYKLQYVNGKLIGRQAYPGDGPPFTQIMRRSRKRWETKYYGSPVEPS